MSSSSLPSDEAYKMAQVADPRHGRPLAEHGRALPGRGDHRAIVGDRQPRAHARLLIDVLRSPRRAADLLDQLLHEVGNDDGEVRGRRSEVRIRIGGFIPDL